MNTSEHALVSYLTEIKPRKIGFMELFTNVAGLCADIHLDARYDLFTSECIFDDCDDAQAKLLLNAFLSGDLSVGWSVSEQLSKLLSTRGHLVRETIDHLLITTDWKCCYAKQLFLSYLALRSDGPELAGRLLDQLGDDFRDGLFLACYRLNSEELDRKLMAKFVEWDREGQALAATGHIYALRQFIAKWLQSYPYRDIEEVIRIYFRNFAND